MIENRRAQAFAAFLKFTMEPSCLRDRVQQPELRMACASADQRLRSHFAAVFSAMSSIKVRKGPTRDCVTAY